MQMFSSAAPGIARNSYNITGQNNQSLRYVILRQVAVTGRKLPCCRVIYSPETLSCPYLVLILSLSCPCNCKGRMQWNRQQACNTNGQKQYSDIVENRELCTVTIEQTNHDTENLSILWTHVYLHRHPPTHRVEHRSIQWIANYLRLNLMTAHKFWAEPYKSMRNMRNGMDRDPACLKSTTNLLRTSSCLFLIRVPPRCTTG